MTPSDDKPSSVLFKSMKARKIDDKRLERATSRLAVEQAFKAKTPPLNQEALGLLSFLNSLDRVRFSKKGN